MKYISLLLILSYALSCKSGYGQTTADPVTTPGSNFILTQTFTGANKATSYTDITYYNGLGYPSQTINVKASPTNSNNIVTPYYYDSMWHQDARSYLPYVANAKGNLYEPNAFADQKAYYEQQYGAEEKEYAFVEKIYHKSFQDRPLDQINAGSAFRKNGNKAKSYNYDLNKADGVLMLSFDLENNCLRRTGNYADYMLYKSSVRSEDGLENITFTDKWGRTLLTRAMSGNDKVDTYYAYDDFGRLALVLTPLGVSALPQSTTWQIGYQDPLVREYCYTYKYDKRGNVVQKHLPGEKFDHQMTYDEMGRVLTYWDGNYKPLPTNPDQIDEYIVMHYTYDQMGRVTSLSNQYVSGLPTTPETPKKFVVVSQTHYDDYLQVPADLNFAAVTEVTESTVKPENCDDRIVGKKAYEKLLVVDENSKTSPRYVERVFYYDPKGRLLQTVERDHLGKINRMSNQYDFSGNPVWQFEYFDYQNGASSCRKQAYFKYDSRGRMTNENPKINEGSRLPARYKYDDLGRLIENDAYGMINQLKYNIQGWLTETKWLKSKITFMAKTLRYFDPIHSDIVPSYSGNITELDWKFAWQSVNTYAFTYDGFDRLKNTQRYVSNLSTPVKSYTEQGMTYDKNGNILSLQRYASSATDPVHDFTYTYSGNKLTRIDGTSSGDYGYDAKGNMTYDGRKGLKIEYNFLNLPQRIDRPADGTTVHYTYLADGTKLGVCDNDGHGYDYCSSLVYTRDGDSLNVESIGCNNGRFIKIPTGYPYEIHVRDHLGSVCMVMEPSGRNEFTDYYPFGGHYNQLGAALKNRYLFCGKEEQVVGDLGWYDHGARMYDSEIGRWMVPDPLAEKYPGLSPYAYCANNPVKYVDPDGRDWYLNQRNGELYFNRKMTDNYATYNNQNYTRIGDNQMMGDMGETIEKPYGYNESQNLAGQNGYNIAPDRQLIHVESSSQSQSTGKKSITVTNEDKTIVNEHYSLISSKQEMVAGDANTLESSYDNSFVTLAIQGVKSSSRTYVQNYTPTKKTRHIGEAIYNFAAAVLAGQHTYTDETIYPSWSAYIEQTKGAGPLVKHRTNP